MQNRLTYARQRVLCAQGQETKGKPKEKPSPDKVQEFAKDLKRRGIDRATAQKVLQLWNKLNVQDPATLRKLLRTKSFRSAGPLVAQLLLDVGACVHLFD